MKKLTKFSLFAVAISFMLLSCKNESNNDLNTDTTSDTLLKKSADTARDSLSAINTVIENKLFSIPSPIQTAMLIKDVNTVFDPTLLHPLSAGDNYITEYKKALNLGVYGSNISYLALFNESKKLIDYVSYVESISDELGLINSFSAELLDKFQQNLTNEDSILVLLSEAFRNGDVFLKENERKDVSMLILTGGFVETMYMATKIYEATNSDLFIQRIAEQKESVTTIIEVLRHYQQNKEYSDLIDKMNNLFSTYEKMNLEYVYIPSETDANQKITTIKSKTVISMDKAVKTELIQKIQDLRNYIIA